MKRDKRNKSGDTLRFKIFRHPDDVKLTVDQIRLLLPIEDSIEIRGLLQIHNVTSDIIARALINVIEKQNIRKYEKYQLLSTVKLDLVDVEKMWKKFKDPSVRTALLQNPSIGAENASTFAKSANSAYRFAIAHNTAASVKDLAVLASDESVSTRAAVAANISTSVEVLTNLASDEADVVRANVAGNSKTPVTVLTTLRKRDGDPAVRRMAGKTLKALETARTTESLLRQTIRSIILNEAMSDDVKTPDIMSPHWSDIQYGKIRLEEFIVIYLLQNNGHATREEINDAFQNWKGSSGGYKDLWFQNKWATEIIRGSTAGGSGWYWAPPGVNKGALFRLTPAGASMAMDILKEFSSTENTKPEYVTSAKAKPGRTYYVPKPVVALDVTGYEKGKLDVERIAVDRQGNIIRDASGKARIVKKLHDRSKRAFKYTSPNGDVKYVTKLPDVKVQANAPVEFIKVIYGLENLEPNQAMVKHGDRYLIIQFPLWVLSGGGVPDKEKHVPPPVKKTHPSVAQRPEPAAPAGEETPAAAAAATRGPKVGYKIYGRKGSSKAHTRLKGQAYGAPNDTQFSPGEQAEIQVGDDGKLKVKKVGGNHSQVWDPIDG
jgi:hypothetical protein